MIRGISKPTIDLVASSDSGKEDAHGSDTDNLTNDTTPTFTFGNIDDDVEKVEVFNGTTLLGVKRLKLRACGPSRRQTVS